jgi:ribosomal-protein-alanine N-acetyltransferase
MLRPLFKSDMPELLMIEQVVHAVPWSEETFKVCFQAGYLGWVLEQDKQIVGFIIVTMRVEECHILNLCVASAYQRQGLGRQLLEHALGHAQAEGLKIAYLEVRRSNTRAIALYQKEHFYSIGERKEYYSTPMGKEDALIFAKILSREEKI